MPQTVKLRAGLGAFALFLALCGLWLLAPDLLGPQIAGLAQNRGSANAASLQQPEAQRAAEVGLIRGDLWAKAALADSILLWQGRQPAADTSATTRATANIERALALAPINGEGWLFLALLPASSSTGEDRVATLLEMSYFTAPHAFDLAPLRIERAATSDALADKTVQELVKSDIRLILGHRPQLKGAVVAAYRNARPQNQPIFEALAVDIDPSFAQTLHQGQAK